MVTKELLGCRQAVRHGVLIPACAGSNPATPAKLRELVLLNILVRLD